VCVGGGGGGGGGGRSLEWGFPLSKEGETFTIIN
jgi:hypothetical protein